MISATLSSPGLKDLRPVSRGIAIVPRERSASRPSSRDTRRKSRLQSDSASSVQSVADESLSLVDIESMLLQKVKDRKDALKAAFLALDQESSGAVTKGEFRRVMEGFLLPLSHCQFDGLVAKVPTMENGMIPYMEFLQQYCKISKAPVRIPSGSGSQRSWPLGELQCRLKDKIGGNLKNITRAFRLFDYNRDGQIQQHELRKVLESYCFPLNHQEFHRLWSHYSPNNSRTISYKEFLERLGVECENYRKIAPDSAKLALNWDATNRFNTRPKSRTSAWETSSVTQYNMDDIHAMFLKKMDVSYSLVEKALGALDVTDTGVVSYDDLKSVVSSFLFPVPHTSLVGLLNRFGVNPAQPVEWRAFLALFRNPEAFSSSPASEIQKDAGTTAGTTSCRLAAVAEVFPKLRERILEAFPHLKRAFLVFDENRSGQVSCVDLRKLLESLTFTLTDAQFRGLSDLLHVPHSGSISYQHVLDFFQKEIPEEVNHSASIQVQEQIGAASEKNKAGAQTLPAVQSPSATAAWTVVNDVLKEQLSDHYSALMSSLSDADPTQSRLLPPDDLKKILHEHGLPLSDSHFNKLCDPFKESGSGAVDYKLLLASLGIFFTSDNVTERNTSAYQDDVESVKKRALVDVVLKKLRDRLQMRRLTLQQCLMDTGKSCASVLHLQDFRKILDDCRISVDARQFQTLVQTLGFFDGTISFSDFVDKYEDVTAKENNKYKSNNIKTDNFLSAEECLHRLEERIKEHHGDVLTAFRRMDRNNDGSVSYNDFSVLFQTLRMEIKEKEYLRLLELLGFKPGCAINYAEFYSKVRSDPKTERNLVREMTVDQILDGACDQVHDYLVATAHNAGSELSKAFTKYGEDTESRITKNELREILYCYYLPITPREFEKIWARYDDDGKGYVTKTEFMNKLNKQSPVAKNIYRRVSQNILTEPELNHLKECLKHSFEDMRSSLEELDKTGDGHVTASDLLSLLRKHGFQIKDLQLLGLIKNLGLDVCKLSYQDFLERLAGPRLSSSGSVVAPGSPAMRSSITGDSVENLSPDRALEKVRELVTDSSDTLTKAFTAFDKARNGKLAQPEFRRVLDRFCIKLSDVQYLHLLSMLSIKEEESLVDWKQFLHIFNCHNQKTSEEWLEKVNKVRFPNQARLLPVTDILTRIQEVVSARIYTIAQEMVDFDYAGVNMISKEDFRTVCDRHFMRLTDEQFEDLWKILPSRGFGNLDYRKFLKRFSRETGNKRGSSSRGPSETSMPSSPQCPKTASCIPGRNKTSSAVCGSTESTLLNTEVMERRLRSQIRSSWQAIQRKCRKIDTGNTGEIDIEAFLGILQDFHINLTRSQLDQLSVTHNAGGTGRLSYPEFLQHFVLTLNPLSSRLARRRKLHLPLTLSSGPMSKQCMDTLLRLCPSVQLCWRSVKQGFVSCDSERTGKISLQDFRKVLRQYNVDLSEDEVFYLASYFDKDITGRLSFNEFLSVLQK